MIVRKKIIHVNFTMNIGGIESFLMNVIKNTDSSEYQIILLTYEEGYFDFEDEINSLGCKIIRISSPSKVSKLRHVFEMIKIFRQEKPHAVTSHTYFNSSLVMIAALLAGVKKRIVHSHTTYANHKTSLIKKGERTILRKIINLLATKKLACSYEAGEALYKNNNFTIIPNGIDLSKFKFSEGKRSKIRKDLGISKNTIVVGHVGRIELPKNHSFMIDIFEKFQENLPNSILILVGTGKLENEIKSKINQKGLTNKVVLLGNRNDVDLIVNAFDLFLFPSIYEGLPVTLIEIQTNGIPSITSDNVSPEVKITDCIKFYPLTKSASEWAEKMVNIPIKRIDTIDDMNKSQYNINNTVKKLNELYR